MKDQNKYLIIGGSTKCGTTSLFSYFQFHPQVCPCIMKESRYFLEKDYFVMTASRKREHWGNFSELFMNCAAGQVRLEATPDYLYSAAALSGISGELGDTRLLFILRNPVSRLVSWYKFGTLNGMIGKETTFREFVTLQKQDSGLDTPQHLRALEQGRYSGYLEKYLQQLGAARVKVVFYEDLSGDPLTLCREVCSFAGIDPTYFDHYEFRIFNKSVPVKSVSAHLLLRKIRRSIRPLTRMLPAGIREKLKFAGHRIEEAYQTANRDEDTGAFAMDPETAEYLRNYYSGESEAIRKLTGTNPPW